MATRRRSVPAEPGDVPAELRDPNHRLWRDQAAFLDYAEALGFLVPVADRHGGPGASPGNRRQAAAGAWAVRQGIVGGSHPDWRRLHEWGLA